MQLYVYLQPNFCVCVCQITDHIFILEQHYFSYFEQGIITHNLSTFES